VVQSTFGTTLDPILRYTTNGHINPDDTIYDNVRRILATCNGYLIFSNGRYILKLNRERTTAEQTLSNLYQINEDKLWRYLIISLQIRYDFRRDELIVGFILNNEICFKVGYFFKDTIITILFYPK
jgi:hypothetical protein